MNPEHPDWDLLVEQGSRADISCGPGWDELVMMTHHSLRALDPDYKILQIKEKFGGLRYYFHPSDEVEQDVKDRMWAIEALVGRLSECICEECGGPGQPDYPSKYWIQTLCKDCLAEAKERRRLRYQEVQES
jgi:hypothetical protein